MKYYIYASLLILASIAIPNLVEQRVLLTIVGMIWCIVGALLLHGVYIYIKTGHDKANKPSQRRIN